MPGDWLERSLWRWKGASWWFSFVAASNVVPLSIVALLSSCSMQNAMRTWKRVGNSTGTYLIITY